MEAVQEIALPKVKGSTVDQLPENLYVPPKALLLLLDVFSGPMDFLLYLIQRKNLDILEVNLIEITDQYIAYIEMMEDFDEIIKQAKTLFKEVKFFKPMSSRNESKETYIHCKILKTL